MIRLRNGLDKNSCASVDRALACKSPWRMHSSASRFIPGDLNRLQSCTTASIINLKRVSTPPKVIHYMARCKYALHLVSLNPSGGGGYSKDLLHTAAS